MGTCRSARCGIDTAALRALAALSRLRLLRRLHRAGADWPRRRRVGLDLSGSAKRAHRAGSHAFLWPRPAVGRRRIPLGAPPWRPPHPHETNRSRRVSRRGDPHSPVDPAAPMVEHPYPDMTTIGADVVGLLYLPLVAWAHSSPRSPPPTPGDATQQQWSIGPVSRSASGTSSRRILHDHWKEKWIFYCAMNASLACLLGDRQHLRSKIGTIVAATLALTTLKRATR